VPVAEKHARTATTSNIARLVRIVSSLGIG
jgi:hypothetical protein